MRLNCFRPVALCVWLACSWPVVARSAECPGFPQRGVEIIDALYENHKGLAHGDDDARRMLTRMIAEQMRFELGAWSTKSASPTRPPSKDSLALPINGGPTFCNWDWQNGQTRVRSVVAGQAGEFLDDQHLLPTNAVNHLGGIVNPPVTPVPPIVNPPTSQPTLDAIRSELNALRDDVRVIRAAQEAIKADQDKRDERIVKLLDESRLREDALSVQLQVHDEKVNKLMAVLSSPTAKALYMVVGGLLAGKFGLQ